MSEKHKLHNVRLDDEVWAAVKAMGCSLNQYLRTALLDHPLTANSMVKLAASSKVEQLDPRDIPGVSVGVPPKKEVAGGFPCRCIHSGCNGSRFTGMSRSENLCPDCFVAGHHGDPRNCSTCADDSGTGAI